MVFKKLIKLKVQLKLIFVLIVFNKKTIYTIMNKNFKIEYKYKVDLFLLNKVNQKKVMMIYLEYLAFNLLFQIALIKN